MNKEEVEKVMLSFYNKNQIDNNTINLSLNKSLFEWISEFVNDDTTHNLIETTYKNISDKLQENLNINDSNNELNAEGLLHQPWVPVTVDIHYDLHHYRIFVIRKSGQYDIDQFRKSVELNKDAYLRSRICPDISLDAIIKTEIPEWWDGIRVYVVSGAVFVIMSLYILYDRYKYNQLLKNHRKATKN